MIFIILLILILKTIDYIKYNEYFEVKDISENITTNYNPVLINKSVNELVEISNDIIYCDNIHDLSSTIINNELFMKDKYLEHYKAL
jgi:hypothetical protein|tara:strand:+ start:2227 stop:2487 length:261 start_codon:yes stop_codon:yes gene_type:complete